LIDLNNNLHMIIGLVGIGGLAVSMLLVGVLMFTLSAFYLRKPMIAGLIGNLSSFTVAIGVILLFIRKDLNKNQT
jgi:hypothetical protein